MSRVEHLAEGVTLYLGDCREILPTLGKVDAVVTDPPYGINEAAGKNASRSKLAVSKDYGNDDWDSKPIDAELMRLVRAAGRFNIIFGGNYYDSPAASCWLVWDKENGASDFADCELAWTNLPKAVRRIKFMWNGMLRANGEKRGDHPTQKPIGVMKWCIQQIPPPRCFDPRSAYGLRHNGRCGRKAGPQVHRNRDRAEVFRHSPQTHSGGPGCAGYVCRATSHPETGGPPMSFHRWVRHHIALDYCRLGWMPLPTLDGTGHGEWSVHVCWLCSCVPVEPKREGA